MAGVSFGMLAAEARSAGVFWAERACPQIDDNKCPRTQSVEAKVDMFVNQFAAS
jgi:hypothetical protein